MTVKVSKPAINVREKLAELDYGHVPYHKMPAGSVIQVATGSRTAWGAYNTTGFVASGLSSSISPKSATSKILISVSLNGIYVANSSLYIIFRLYKDGVAIDSMSDNYGQNLTVVGGSLSYQHLYSSNSTETALYELRFRGSVSGTFGINNYGLSGNNQSRSTITLMEIAQ
tara:strand:+ start:463 stop:975 length:513 start_codon:yes stop_codon:yes gene_type:complete